MAIELPGAPGPAGDVLEGRVIPPPPPDDPPPAPPKDTDGRDQEHADTDRASRGRPSRDGRTRAWERPRRPAQGGTGNPGPEPSSVFDPADPATDPAPTSGGGRWYRIWSNRTAPDSDTETGPDPAPAGPASGVPAPRPTPEPAPAPVPPVRDLPVSTGGPIHVHVTLQDQQAGTWRWGKVRAWLRAWVRPRQTLVAALLAFVPAWQDGHSLASAWVATVELCRIEAGIGAAYVLAYTPLLVTLFADMRKARLQGVIWRTALLITITGAAAVISPWDLVALLTGVRA